MKPFDAGITHPVGGLLPWRQLRAPGRHRQEYRSIVTQFDTDSDADLVAELRAALSSRSKCRIPDAEVKRDDQPSLRYSDVAQTEMLHGAAFDSILSYYESKKV